MIDINQCPVCGSTAFNSLFRTKDHTVTQETFSIQVCQQCSLGITTPRPVDNELGKYYLSDDYISHSNKPTTIIDFIYTQARKIALKWKWEIIHRYQRPNILLDYGCGTGHFIQYVRSRKLEAYGIEPSERARTTANEINKSKVVVSTLAEFPTRPDVITLWHVMEHVPDLRENLLALKQKLSSGGLLVIAVPNRNSWESMIYKEHWAAYDVPRHLWHFTQDSMQRLLSTNGLRLLGTHPMKLDAYYISLLSEKYQHQGSITINGIKNALLHGFKSNKHAENSGEYSSLIYIAKNDN